MITEGWRAAVSQKARDKAPVSTQEETPDVVPAQRAQVVPVGSMDVDSTTGAPIRVGVPESSDEEIMADFILWLQEEANAANEDSMSILADQLRRAMTAESVAEALREKTTVNGKDFVGQPFMATGFAIHEGKFEDDEIPYFASIDAIDANHPDGFVVNCGGGKVLAHMRALQRLQAFPIPMCITAKETKKKRIVLSIEILQQNPR